MGEYEYGEYEPPSEGKDEPLNEPKDEPPNEGMLGVDEKSYCNYLFPIFYYKSTFFYISFPNFSALELIFEFYSVVFELELFKLIYDEFNYFSPFSWSILLLI